MNGIVFTSFQENTIMHQPLPGYIKDRLQAELAELDREAVMVEGKLLKPSQCYYFDTDPAHILFNTNCPDTLKSKVQAILAKYIPDESGTQ